MNEEHVLQKKLFELTFKDELTPDDIKEIFSILDRLDEIEPIRDIPDVDTAYEKLKEAIDEKK